MIMPVNDEWKHSSQPCFLTTKERILMKEPSILDGRLQVFLATLIGGWLLTFEVIHLVAAQNMRLYEYTQTQLMIATGLWGFVFFSFLFTRFFKETAANTSEIWANPFVTEEIPKPGTFTGMEELHGQRALRAGWNLTFPQEYLVEGGIIETNKKTIVEIPAATFKTLDEKQLQVSGCRLVLTVLPPYEVNHFRYIMGHGPDVDGYEELKKYFLTEATAFLQQYMITHNAEYIQSHLEDFKKAFKEQFGGLGAIDPREERTGTWTGEPSFGRVQEPQSIIDAESLEGEMVVVEKLYRKILGDNTGMDPNEAWRMAMAFAKKININFDISETTSRIQFVDADKLPEGMTHVSIMAGGVRAGVGGGKNKGGGGQNRGQNKPGAPLPPQPKP